MAKQLCGGHDGVDAATKGRQHATRIEGGSVGDDVDPAFDDHVVERQIVAVGELGESVAQGGVKKPTTLRPHRCRREVNSTRRAHLVIRESGDHIPELGDGPNGRRQERTDTLEHD